MHNIVCNCGTYCCEKFLVEEDILSSDQFLLPGRQVTVVLSGKLLEGGAPNGIKRGHIYIRTNTHTCIYTQF